MIELKITAGSLEELATILASASGVVLSVAAEPAAPKPTGRGRKTAEATAGAAETGSGQTTSTTTAASAETSPSNSLDKDALAARCTAYGQKAGREALKQLFILLGAPDGKWTQVPADKYPALDQSLTDFGF